MLRACVTDRITSFRFLLQLAAFFNSEEDPKNGAGQLDRWKYMERVDAWYTFSVGELESTCDGRKPLSL